MKKGRPKKFKTLFKQNQICFIFTTILIGTYALLLVGLPILVGIQQGIGQGLGAAFISFLFWIDTF